MLKERIDLVQARGEVLTYAVELGKLVDPSRPTCSDRFYEINRARALLDRACVRYALALRGDDNG